MQNIRAHEKIVQTIIDSIPFIKKFSGHNIIIKYGGAAQTSSELKENFALDIVLMYMCGIRPVIVHGGGKRIDEVLAKLNIECTFIDGYRVTSEECMRVVEMVLSGEINKELSAFLNYHDVRAIGISGKDSRLLEARAKDNGKLGYTGEITKVNIDIIHQLLSQNLIPVVAPIALGEHANHIGFNINADIAACHIAKAMRADKIIFLSDVQGVMDANKKLISELNPTKIRALKAQGVISKGMIPKLEACIDCLQSGVKKAHIIDGRIKHSLLLELFTSEGIGTQIVND